MLDKEVECAPIFSEFDNVFYESPMYLFDELNEISFLKDLFQKLYSLMGDIFSDYVFFIFSYDRKQNILPESAIFETSKKKILIYISDESGNIPYYLSPYYYGIFKMYLQLNKFCVDNIFNFPLGCVKNVPQLPVIPIAERKYNVFFCGNLNQARLSLYYYLLFGNIPHKIIRKAIQFLSRINLVKGLFTRITFDHKFSSSYIRFTNGFKKGLSPKLYGEVLANSKIVLCPKGFHSTECFRHFESMRAGCIIISEKLPPTFFYKDSPIIQISDWLEGINIVNELINDTAEMENRSKKMLDWWEKHCSENATAHYIVKCIDIIKKKKNGA
jgi:hypothetical protein